MAFVKMTQSVFNCEAGRVYELDDAFARSFIETKKAEPISASEFLAASRKADDESLRTSIMSEVGAEVKRALAEFGSIGGKGKPEPPNGGGGVNFEAIASGEDPYVKANERSKTEKRGIGEALRLVGMAGKPWLSGVGQQGAQWATRRLQHMCGEVSEQKFNESTGQFTETIRRDLSNGGLETITRTGTDSLSGGTTYGFALKPEFLGNLFEISMEQQVFVNATTQIPVSQGVEVRWPSWDQYQTPQTVNGVMQSAVFAGVTLYYLGEAAPRNLTDANLNTINFKIVDLTAFTALSRDFVVDNYLAFDSQLTRMIGRAFGWMEDYMSIQGPGVGRPQGYFNSGATLVVNRATASKIAPIDLTTMISKASAMCWQDLRWITNVTTIPYLSILQDASGTYVFQPNALINQAMELSAIAKSIGGSGAELMHRPMGTLLGFPVYFSEKVPTLGNTGDLSLVSPQQFGVARRSGMEIAVSEHFYFSTDLIAYRMKERHDMKSLWRAPYTQADGSNTQVSPFVLLH